MSRCSTCWGIVAYLEGWGGTARDSGIVLGIVDGAAVGALKFTELLLSTTSVKIGSLPSPGQGTATTVLAAIVEEERCNLSTKSQWTDFWGRFGGAPSPPVQCSGARKLPGFLQISFQLLPRRPKLRSPLSPNVLHCVLMRMMNLVFVWEVRQFWRRGTKMSAITKIIGKENVDRFVWNFSRPRHLVISVINPYDLESKERERTVDELYESQPNIQNALNNSIVNPFLTLWHQFWS